MKILQISNYLYPHIGGIEQVARDCATALKNENIQQKIMCFNHEKGTKVDFVDEIEVIRVGCFAKIASQSLSFAYKRELKKIISEFQPNIVIFHHPNPLVAHFLLKYRKKDKFSLILYYHLDITKQKILGKFFIGQTKRLLAWATKIVATSPNYISGNPFLSLFKDKCVVVPCCVNSERLHYTDKHLQIANTIKEKYKGKTICFAFGRHVEYKGLTYLIKASKLLDDNFKVLIGGKGPLTEKLMKEAKTDPKVQFLGKISDDELKAYMLACDIFCFPSITKNEAFGIGLAEAMFYSKPVITFTINGSGVNYVSINGLTGIEVENKNINAYAEAIKKLSKNKELSLLYGSNARYRVESLFTNRNFDDNIDRLIKSI